MPLQRSASKEAFSQNVGELMHTGRPQKQAVAIAYSVKRKALGKIGRTHRKEKPKSL